MPAVWDAHFGFVQQKTGRAILVGEWGGTYEGIDKVWQQAAAAYFAERGIGSFYFCLNPGSLDTGGLLEHDWVRGRPPSTPTIAQHGCHTSLLASGSARVSSRPKRPTPLPLRRQVTPKQHKLKLLEELPSSDIVLTMLKATRGLEPPPPPHPPPPPLPRLPAEGKEGAALFAFIEQRAEERAAALEQQQVIIANTLPTPTPTR